jgi:hypothetical protein
LLLGAAVLAIAALPRAAAAIAYRPALFYSDSWAYVVMAYGPTHWDPTRPSGYAFLLLILGKVTHSLAAITTLQHLGGLALVALVYWLSLRLGASRWLAAAVALIVGLDAWLIVLEQTPMAETAFALMLAGALALAIVAGHRRWWLLIPSGGLLAFACTTRAAALFAIPVWLVYVSWRQRRLVPVAAATVAFAVPLAAYVVEYHHVYGVHGLAAANGWFRYGRVAQLADCSRFTPPAGTERLCQSEAERQGRRPIFYLWNETSPARKAFGEVSADRRENRLLGKFASKVVRSRPVAYAGMVASDFAGYFTPGRSSPGTSDVAITFPEEPRTGPFFKLKARNRYETGYQPAVHEPSATLRAYAKVFHTPRWLLALALLAVVAQAVLALSSTWRRALGHTPEVLLLAGVAVAMLLGATTTSAFVIRYLVPAAPLLLVAGAVAVTDLLAARRLVTDELLGAPTAGGADLLRDVGHPASERAEARVGHDHRSHR